MFLCGRKIVAASYEIFVDSYTKLSYSPPYRAPQGALRTEEMMEFELSSETRNGLFFYRVYDPGYRQFVTIDSGATNEAAAFADLRRYVKRVNRSRPMGIRLPPLKHPKSMQFEARA